MVEEQSQILGKLPRRLVQGKVKREKEEIQVQKREKMTGQRKERREEAGARVSEK